jgi:hypothetical protein
MEGNVPLKLKGTRTSLPGADFSGAEMWEVNLEFADLPGANLRGASLTKANLRRANLSGANLTGADLYEADLYQADLSDADLTGARLTRVRLVDAKVEGTILESCNIYGTAVWNLTSTLKRQSNLIITDPAKGWEPAVSVDDLEVAQFVYLLLRHEKIRNVIQTIGKRAVLILGRFSPERKEVLDAVAAGLRSRGFLPMIFDFEKSSERDFTETIKILAGLSLFVIVDITNPKSSPLELQATVPDYEVPFVPIIQKGEEPFSMFRDLKKYPWVLDVRRYGDKEMLLRHLDADVIQPALKKHNELIGVRAEELKILDMG